MNSPIATEPGRKGVEEIKTLMGFCKKKKDFLINKYYRVINSGTKYECVFDSCKNALVLNKKCNLLQYLAHKHFSYLDYSDDTVKKESKLNIQNAFKSANEKEHTVEIKISKSSFYNSLLDIVLGGESFNQIEGEAFKPIL